ncbi:hypothetical protein HYH03_013027 [Edaphochlamys debaryana]|uniref:Glycosyl transferase CAP10 domain-containing protein n=1 Tax=Edaphochlamys debaryana TaxID=47281 RepID=A0A836BTQ8_9CHLO|nr:hypothetical protein HYH03_013027 [Edaphochlamys debaryana]|eukprot:KAG2488337.1 hypothetical protein HYH03_013027 [Edaphochlamys debaryana]
MEPKVFALRLLAVLAAATLSGATLEEDSASVSGSCPGECSLHPAMRARISKDVEWLDKWGGITDAMIRNISLVCDAQTSNECNVKAMRIMIKDGEVYLNSLHPEWRLGPYELIGFLLELYETSKVYRLPDLEFAYNGDDNAVTPAFDWQDPVEYKNPTFHGGPFPIVAWSKTSKSFALTVPYSGAFRCGEDSWDRILHMMDEVSRIPWSERKQVALGRWNLFCSWRYVVGMPPLKNGEPFICPRKHLPTLTEAHKDLLDVGVINDQRGGPEIKPVPLMHQNAYRYLVSTDGWAISSKFDKYLLLGSTVIKAASNRFGFYYDALRPGEHYLECMRDNRTDLVEAILWARSHDDEAARIAANAQRFAARHLNRPARLCYYRTLIQELGKRMKYTPSCANRKMCIPLGRFLQFLTTFPKSRKKCRYAEVLLPYGVNHSLPYTSDADLELLLKVEKLWPRDTDIPPLDNEPYFARG